jgi:hypothetical protein
MKIMRLTKEECRQLKGWYKKLQAREREIFEAVASELGYDHPAEITDPAKRQALADEVEHIIDRWEEDVKMSDSPPTSTEGLTPLQVLLYERSLVEDEIEVLETMSAEREARERVGAQGWDF